MTAPRTRRRKCWVCNRPAPPGKTLHAACAEVTRQIHEAHAEPDEPDEAAAREARLLARGRNLKGLVTCD